MKPVLKRIENAETTAQERAEDILPVAVLFGGVTLILLLFGLTMLYSTSFGTAGSTYFLKQLMWACVGGPAHAESSSSDTGASPIGAPG